MDTIYTVWIRNPAGFGYVKVLRAVLLSRCTTKRYLKKGLMRLVQHVFVSSEYLRSSHSSSFSAILRGDCKTRCEGRSYTPLKWRPVGTTTKACRCRVTFVAVLATVFI